MALAPNPTVRQRRLGTELRRLREICGLSLEDVALRLECSDSKVSRIELGRSGVRPVDLRILLDLYGVVDEGEREALLTLAREAKKRGWWRSYSSVLPPSYTELLSLEADASGMRGFELSLVPGLLQTPDYARAIISSVRDDLSPDEIDTLVQVRGARQAILGRTGPDGEPAFRLTLVLAEAVLRQVVGGRETMRAQLAHLAEASQQPNIRIQVLPFACGAHPAIEGAFAVIEFPALSDLDVVVVDTRTSSLYLEDSAQVRVYQRMFDDIRASALSYGDSSSMIEHAAKELS
ncbi:helix-turn-helix domain-containing protein [Yinghuangia sp. ASG 101]|uniref:helix-turn-helix domain-containing protein n=1 Tax=Yinghuangia sp. ASG 101 TaxID=2896848 RepID=UPI001E41DD0E|nr:helix-turn-helix transcriptional regulator [Yinghuangia sp. ASG 101]UGQ13737.1 helix-turn-helix domain-containing protein [Yinghuangia sp. ASG 101]